LKTQGKRYGGKSEAVLKMRKGLRRATTLIKKLVAPSCDIGF
jgi:hypothetical protein